MQKERLLYILYFVLFLSMVIPAVLGQTPEKAQIVHVAGVVESREIFITGVDGTNKQRLTNNAFADTSPVFSPDGQKIAFSSERDGNWEIYVMDSDGNNQRNLTNNPAQDSFPSWSPDNQKIVFSASQNESAPDIYVMDFNGNNLRRLTNEPAFDDRPTWSSDGQKIAFESNRFGVYNIFIMDKNGGNVIRLENKTDWERNPDWFDPSFASLISHYGMIDTAWAWIKRLE